MKRSQLNRIIADAVAFCKAMNFLLPPFAYWTLEDWVNNRAECAEIIDNQMGWDITDFGSGDFQKIGLLIFVLRNGNFTNTRYKKPYCEKILIQDEGQLLPLHYHWVKMEDIINRGGGNLMVTLYNAISETEWDTKTPVNVSRDGRTFEVAAGEPFCVPPGESITLMPKQFHKFWADTGRGKVLLGEVSTVADEATDNNFPEYSGRLPIIEEDALPQYLIFNDYSLLDNSDAWPESWKTSLR